MNRTTKTAEEHRAEAARHTAAAEESFERCDTDGFLSQWAHGVNAQKDLKNAQIAENGGVATFFRYRLETLDGEPVNAKVIDGRYGECWALLDDADKFTGEFVTAFPKRESTMARKGYREVRETFVAPAEAELVGSTTVYAVARPADKSLRYRRDFHGVECIGAADDESADS